MTMDFGAFEMLALGRFGSVPTGDRGIRNASPPGFDVVRVARLAAGDVGPIEVG